MVDGGWVLPAASAVCRNFLLRRKTGKWGEARGSDREGVPNYKLRSN
jgi:hypothetical protein